MKLNNNIWVLFLFPLLADITIHSYDKGFNTALLIITITASVIGATARAGSNNEKAHLKFRNLFAIYSLGGFFCMLSVFLGHYYNSITLGGVASGLMSFYGVEFMSVFAKIIKNIPEIAKNILKNWVNGK